MERDSDAFLVPPVQGAFGIQDKEPPLRLHPIERELHALTGSTMRMASALERIVPSLETISKNIAALRELVERGSR